MDQVCSKKNCDIQWRVCFRFEDGNAYDVAIIDYH